MTDPSVPTALPPLPSLDTVRERLALIFPEGMAQRNYFVREMAARTVFVLLYLGAVAGTGRWARPNQVTRMSDSQAAMTSDAERRAWASASVRKQAGNQPGRWFADTTREPIRDETLRSALLAVGAAVERDGVAITSSTPRWALAPDFAELFTVPDAELPGRIDAWRAARLSPQALARIALARGGVAASQADHAVLVRFPNGETRRLSPGRSAEITRAVVEAFAPRFLVDPGVLWISDSREQVVARDDALARRVGLRFDRQELLPDVVLVDLGAPEPPLFVFVEVVATDGPVTSERRDALLALLRAAGHAEAHAAFVTAFRDRDDAAFRRAIGAVAWESFVWCATEPERIIVQRDTMHRPARLTDLL